MFVDINENPTSYLESKGRCAVTDSELAERLALN